MEDVMRNEAYQEIVRLLGGAVQAEVDTVGLEYKGRDLMIFYHRGQMGIGAGTISEDLQQAVIEEIVERARLQSKSRGKMPMNLLGKEYEVIVEEYDSFGQSAFNLTVKRRTKRAK
jgi:hypothetical protein